jgi:hypothetical protein
MDGVANQKRDTLGQWTYLHDLVEAALRRRLIPDRDLITAGSKKLHNGVVDARMCCSARLTFERAPLNRSLAEGFELATDVVMEPERAV